MKKLQQKRGIDENFLKFNFRNQLHKSKYERKL